MISHKLAAGDFDNLKEFVDINEVKRVQAIVEKMTVAQRSELAINKDDIYFAFPYDVVITEKEDEDDERDTESPTTRVFAEILMVFHVMRGLQRLKDSNVEIPMNIGYVIVHSIHNSRSANSAQQFFVLCFSTSPEFSKDLWVVNYRFRKEFTEGVDDEWTVNLIQQIKSMDELNE